MSSMRSGICADVLGFTFCIHSSTIDWFYVELARDG